MSRTTDIGGILRKFATPFLLLLIGLAVSFSRTAGADEHESLLGPDWKVSVGALGTWEPRYEGGDSHRWSMLPILEINWADTITFGVEDGLRWNAYKNDFFKVGPVVTHYMGSMDYLGNHDRLDRISEIDPGIQVGIFSELFYEGFFFDNKILQSVSGDSEGFRVNAGIGYRTDIGDDWHIMGRVESTFLNDNEMKTYFQVTTSEGTNTNGIGPPPYEPDEGFKDAAFMLKVTYDIYGGLSAQGRTRVGYLLDDAGESPLVKTRGSQLQLYSALGLVYTF